MSNSLAKQVKAKAASITAGAPASVFGDKGAFLADTARREVLRRLPVITDEGRGLWFYEGGVWRPDAEPEIVKVVADLTGEKFRQTHASTVVALLQAQRPEILDEVDVTTVNVTDGMLDWGRATASEVGTDVEHDDAIEPHGPIDRPPSILQFPVSWIEAKAGTTDTADQFLSEVFPDGEAGVSFAYEVLGYGLYDGNPLHRAIMLDGSGRNGKSTFLDLARELYGSHNVSGVSLQSLGDNRFASAQLHRKAANIAGDLDSRALKDSGPFKMITGEDLLMAEQKYAKPFAFTARCLPIFAANEKPLSSDTSTGFLSRWIVVPFAAYFPAGQADRHLKTKLAAEVPGVFYKAIMGLNRLMERGDFDLPPEVERATEAYRAYIDPIRSFIIDIGITIPLNEPDRAHAGRAEVYRAFSRWAEDNGYHRYAARKFNDRFPTAIYEALGVRPTLKTVDGYPKWTQIEMPEGVNGPIGAPA